jgi:hypothetical protein
MLSGGPGERAVAGALELGNEPSAFVKVVDLFTCRDYWFLKKNSVSWSYEQ